MIPLAIGIPPRAPRLRGFQMPPVRSHGQSRLELEIERLPESGHGSQACRPDGRVHWFAMVTPHERDLFDALLDSHVARLPAPIAARLDEVPLIVEDEPSAKLLADMGMDPRRTELCGLHQAVPLTERSVYDTGMLPGRMMLFRGPILRVAGYRYSPIRDEAGRDQLNTQIHITLLHEIGHQFGLDEDDLTRLGYG